MAKLAPPIQFSTYFKIPGAELSKAGVFDPSLNIDSLLFPDPLLLDRSAHAEMRKARATFESYFEKVMMLLHGIRHPEDKVWRTAFKLLSFPEVKGTCLGYSANSTSGSGSGPGMALKLLETGEDIIRMGIDDPDLFMAMGLFEEDFGPDLIGDMLTNIALGEIIAFNNRIIKQFNLPTIHFDISLRNGKRHSAELVRNPTFASEDVPIILLPQDILRALPIATDWREVQHVAAQNEEFRSSLNGSIADLWSKRTLESKEQLKRWAMSNRDAFGNLLDMLHGHEGKPYDFIGDPHGELIWRQIGDKIAVAHPLRITKPKSYDDKSIIEIVNNIIEQFRFLIEERDLWRDLYADGKPRFEKASQRMFYVIAVSYCKANDLDITPEAETGRGTVDFKISSGFERRVLVEIKLSTNKQLIHGFEKQLAIYDAAEKPIASYFVVLNIGQLGKKLETLEGLKVTKAGKSPEIVLINGLPKRSASVA